ncbi:IS30 family transposase [Corynebacterium hiratae]|uniref:IS30 family transposase n=1 Tax=Corynebacterium hiratae TaxID=3139423 RepID=A0A553FW52_9CORY|nr:IS30 family transposase [Corynebacterium aurimucosum]TRX61501.1 IS30 family transposase [Corynebacterium aurimucosum]
MGSLLDVHDSATTVDKLIEMFTGKIRNNTKTLTWDQGVELAQVDRLSIERGLAVYFCDPHSPWQRPTNENTNGLVRDFLPKGSDFSTLTLQKAFNTFKTYSTGAQRSPQLVHTRRENPRTIQVMHPPLETACGGRENFGNKGTSARPYYAPNSTLS